MDVKRFKLTDDLLCKNFSAKNIQEDENEAKILNQVDIRLDIGSVSSASYGRLEVLKAIALQFNQGNIEALKLICIDPKCFLLKSYDQEIVSRILCDESLFCGVENVAEKLHGGRSLSLDDAVRLLISTLRELFKSLGAKIHLNFTEKRSLQFFLDLFDRDCYKSQKRELQDVTALYTRPQSISQPSNEIFVDMTSIVYKNLLETKSFLQIASVTACSRNNLEFEVQSNPIIFELSNSRVDNSTRSKLETLLQEARKCSRDSSNPVGEKDALETFCHFLHDSCSCNRRPGTCDLTLVAFSGQEVFPHLLTKVQEYKLENVFFRHVVSYVDLSRHVRELRWGIADDILKVGRKLFPRKDVSKVDSFCKLMRKAVKKSSVDLLSIAEPASTLNLIIFPAKSTEASIDEILKDSEFFCNVKQSSRPSLVSTIPVNLSDVISSINCDKLGKNQNEPLSEISCKIFVLANISSFTLAEIRPEPKGKWIFAKYSLVTEDGVSKGTTSVFHGKFIILPRKKNFYIGKFVGVCQFERPSLGKNRSPLPCKNQLLLEVPQCEIIIPPSATCIFTLRAADACETAFRCCQTAGHILRLEQITHQNLIPIDEFVFSDSKLKVAVRNISFSPVGVSTQSFNFQAQCCMNENEFMRLLEQAKSRQSFYYLWRASSEDLASSSPPSVVSEVTDSSSSDDDAQMSVDDDGNNDVEVVFEKNPNPYLLDDLDSPTSRSVSNSDCCKNCSDLFRTEKCPLCPEFDVTLTNVQDEYGYCVARILFSEDFKEKSELKLSKFFSTNSLIVCPPVTEVVDGEFILVYYVNLDASERPPVDLKVGTCQIIDGHSSYAGDSSNCKKHRLLLSTCDVVIQPLQKKQIEISWGQNLRSCSDYGHCQRIVSSTMLGLNLPMTLLPFYDLAVVTLSNNTSRNIFVSAGQPVVETRCWSTAKCVKFLIENKKKAPLVERYAPGYLFPMSPSLLLLDTEDCDDEIVEVDVNLNVDCKKSCLSRGFEWSSFCSKCPHYMLLTLSAHILPADGRFITVLCRLVGPYLDDVDECPDCIAIFPSTTSRAVFQVVPSLREVLLCGNSSFAFVTLATRPRNIRGSAEIVSGTLVGFGQKRSMKESLVGDGQCLWPVRVHLNDNMKVEPGKTARVPARVNVPESHKFDPVTVEFGLKLEALGNKDRDFCLQGKNEVFLPIVNNDLEKSLELSRDMTVGNLRLLTSLSSVQLQVLNRTDLPNRPVRFVDTNGRTSLIGHVVVAQNVSVLKNTAVNVLCRIQNTEDFDNSLLRVILLKSDHTTGWTFESKVLTIDPSQKSDKFQLQFTNENSQTIHWRVDDKVAEAKIFVEQEDDERYEIFKVVGRVPIPVSPGRLFTMRCELVRCQCYSDKKFQLSPPVIELVALFELVDKKEIDIMTETRIFDVFVDYRNRHRVVYFDVLSINDSGKTLNPQFVEVGLARGLTLK